MVLLSDYIFLDKKFDSERFDPRNQFFGRIAALEELSDPDLSVALSQETFQAPKDFLKWNQQEKDNWSEEILNLADYGAVFIRAISETQGVQKLKNKLQSPSSAYSKAGKSSDFNFQPFQTSRYDHTMGVCDEAFKLAINSNYGAYETLLALSVASLHDIGHIAFSHTGEEILHTMGFSEFDHDLYSALLASDAEYKNICEQAGLDHKDVIAALIGPKILRHGARENFEIMQEKLSTILGREFSFALDLDSTEDIARIERWKGLHVLVQDYADMFAYGKSDVSQSLFTTNNVKRYVGLIDQASENVSNPEGSIIEISSLEPLRKFQGIYVNYTSRFPLSYSSATVASILRREIPIVASIKDMLTKNDYEIMSMLPQDVQDSANITGIDERFVPTIEVRAPLKIRNKRVNNDELAARISRRIEELIEDGLIGSEFSGLICPTSPIHKKSQFRARLSTAEEMGPLKGFWGKTSLPIVDLLLNKKEYSATDQLQIRLSYDGQENFEVTCDSLPSVCISLEQKDMKYARIIAKELDRLFMPEFLKEGSFDSTVRMLPKAA